MNYSERRMFVILDEQNLMDENLKFTYIELAERLV